MALSLSAPAYALPLLHAARHPSSTVLGLLLASGGEISEALPVLHRYASLSFTIDQALRFATAYAADKGLALAGVYVAHEDGSTALGRAGEMLLATIRRGNPAAIGIVLDNSKLTSTQPVYVSSAELVYPSDIEREKTLQSVKTGGAHKSLVDFDDYLDDSNSDWPENIEAKKAIA